MSNIRVVSVTKTNQRILISRVDATFLNSSLRSLGFFGGGFLNVLFHPPMPQSGKSSSVPKEINKYSIPS